MRHTAFYVGFLVLIASFGFGQAPAKTQIVMLGTGTPNPDPERSGPAVAIVVNGTAYLVDCGPGVMRRAAQAARTKGIAALRVPNIKFVFITHLHSDHTLGYPDLIFTPWVAGRKDALHAFGPHGLKSMTDDLEHAWTKDIHVRTHGLEHEADAGHEVEVHEIAPGMVYQDANVTVTAFQVKHGSWDEAFGYKFQTADRSVVISGDTAPTDAIIQACNGCDVLIHEVYNASLDKVSDDWKKYLAAFHTSTTELAAMAIKARPKLLVLYHQLFEGMPEQELTEQMKRAYSGNFVSARDLDIY